MIGGGTAGFAMVVAVLLSCAPEGPSLRQRG